VTHENSAMSRSVGAVVGQLEEHRVNDVKTKRNKN
jgi:hypothetical protein